MKKLAMLAAVLLGTAAASQAGIDIRIGLPLPPLPRVIFGHPAPVVVVQRPCAPPVVVAPPCGPVYGYGHHHHGYHRHGQHRTHGYYQGHRSHGRDHSRGRDSHGGHRGHR